MTIYSDAIGNRFLGDCIWANHDVAYPSTKFLQAHPLSSMSSELTALMTASGLQFRNVLPQADFNNLTYAKSIVTFSSASDTAINPLNNPINDRYSFNIGGGGGQSSIFPVYAYPDTGYPNTNNDATTLGTGTSYVMIVPSVTEPGYGNIPFPAELPTGTKSQIAFAGVADTESFGLFVYQYWHGDPNPVRTIFYYGGMLADVNSNFNYYSARPIHGSIILTAGSMYQNSAVKGDHYPDATKERRALLQTGDAQYPIVCADAQTPTSQWATDMYVFDNNATLGYPAIGRVRNLLLATGSYTIGKPVKIQGVAMPDAGFNRWLPVGTFAGKTVLMRCYSSVEI